MAPPQALISSTRAVGYPGRETSVGKSTGAFIRCADTCRCHQFGAPFNFSSPARSGARNKRRVLGGARAFVTIVRM